MLVCYVTDRSQFPGSEAERRRRLLDTISEAAVAGVNLIQLRERDLTTRELELLARQAVARIREASNQTRLLINSRIDVALAVSADGVHLRSDDPYASEARAIWVKAGGASAGRGQPTISVSCHSAAEVRLAAAHGADFALLAPIFGKPGVPALGLQELSNACAGERRPAGTEAAASFCVPVLALGGVTLENANACLQAGAAGLAAIRMFQRGRVAETMAALRALTGARVAAGKTE